MIGIETAPSAHKVLDRISVADVSNKQSASWKCQSGSQRTKGVTMHLQARKNRGDWPALLRSITKKARGEGAGSARHAPRPPLTVGHASLGLARHGQARLDSPDSRPNPSSEIQRDGHYARSDNPNRKPAMKAAIDNDSPVEVVISRSATRHCWVVLMGGHPVPLPWADSADAGMVASWVKANASGKVKVQIRL